MKKFLFAPVGSTYKGINYEGVLLASGGKVVAVVTEDAFVYPEGDSPIAEFVSDCLYWKQGRGDKPKNVIAVQDVPISRLISLLTKMLED